MLRRDKGNFSVARLMEMASIQRKKVSLRTVRRVLTHMGSNTCKHGKKKLLLKGIWQRRLLFARRVKHDYPKELWTEMINFYLDGVTFCYKTHPASQARAPTERIWRKKSEGLQVGCTAKGKMKEMAEKS